MKMDGRVKPGHDYQAAEKVVTLASSFDKLRMRSSDFNGLNLMVSPPNHGRHRFSAAC